MSRASIVLHNRFRADQVTTRLAPPGIITPLKLYEFMSFSCHGLHFTPHSRARAHTVVRLVMVGVASQPRSASTVKMKGGGGMPANTGYTPADRMLEKAASLTVQADEIMAAQARLVVVYEVNCEAPLIRLVTFFFIFSPSPPRFRSRRPPLPLSGATASSHPRTRASSS